MTANSQKMSVKHAALVMNISERSVYTAKKIACLRPDLVPKIESGELSLNAAMAMINPKPSASNYDKLVKAWNSASEHDRLKLIRALNSAVP
ncbi:hypothetical protein [Rhizobium sp. L245/93]|uniref:hypothetical protein n=1 Tax=Rhizobium sp. L245/93 TaxID=2819998 RepID=UPI001ADCBF45|nr:hypothetical protein [Rhizobium sp. L245/93]MBO9168342.1 hypothetical protein [Rhizobium sp. L245/93]